MTKKCPRCGAIKPATDFYKNKRCKDGLYYTCKACTKQVQKRYRDKPDVKVIKKQYDRNRSPEQKKEQNAAWIKNRRQKDLKGYKMWRMLVNAKHRAKIGGLAFTISETDFQNWRDLECCPLFPWIRLEWEGDVQTDASPTIDKIVPCLGYVPGNIRIVSCRANLCKGNYTLAELEAVTSDLRDR